MCTYHHLLNHTLFVLAFFCVVAPGLCAGRIVPPSPSRLSPVTASEDVNSVSLANQLQGLVSQRACESLAQPKLYLAVTNNPRKNAEKRAE